MPIIKPLEVNQLYRRCDPSLLPFQTTADVTGGAGIVGQARAAEAIHFGIDIRQPGYNLFVLGKPGSGRHAIARQLLADKAAQESAPSDWCYINNFAEPNSPCLLSVPAGRGGQLKRDMQDFVAELSKAIPAAFESDEHRSRMKAIRDASDEKQEKALEELGKAAMAEGVALLRTPHGFVFAPLKGEEPMPPAEFERLPEAEKQRLGSLIDGFSERLSQLMLQLPRWRREMQAQIKHASRDTLTLAAGDLIEELKEHYADLPGVLAFLDEVMQDIIETGEELRELPKADGELSGIVVTGTIPTQRYSVNLLVDNAAAKAAPVVYEDNPIYPNLVGRVDHIAQLGTLLTNFTLIKPGALHRANGGYLVLDALKVLMQPYAWEGLKRALRSNQVRIESLSQVYGLASTISLEPEPMALTVKVVLIGERRLYYMLKALDPDFSELFKVTADFEDDLARDDDNTRLYATFIATLAHDARLRPLQRDAVARLIEHSARLCGDAERLTANRRQISNLLCEADYWAGKAGRTSLLKEDVEAALDAQEHRVDRLRSRLQAEILRGNLLISVTDGRVGQINGLAVITLDDFVFAYPVRVTATARVGEGHVVDIERETELGGAIHSKGVMILASFLGARYSRVEPFSLAASLVFEQSYGPVEGDSASLAELCALLSALAYVPIRQSLAVTGSVNQFGDVQAIGAVNEKIEGFFDICRARGFSGEQGVLIPVANVKHLMLRADVVKACAEGQFHIYAVQHVDEAIELLTGLPAGEMDENGVAPVGSINQKVSAQLKKLSVSRQAFSSTGHLGGGAPKANRASAGGKGDARLR